MRSILDITKLTNLSKELKRENKKAVLVGGCFDVLHPGHTIFLEKAKKEGEILIVLLESDQKIKKLKGDRRPVHNQAERASVLVSLKWVDYVIELPFMETEEEYDQVIEKIKPQVIAATKGADDNSYKERSAKKVGAKIKYVTEMIGNHSTTNILSR